MVVTLTNPDGSEQTVDVTNVRIILDGAPLDLSMASYPRLDLYSRSDDDQPWDQFAVFHRDANAMSIELHAQGELKTTQ